MPELILYGGTVLTMEPRAPTAQAVAVRGGRVLAVGESASILAMAHNHTERVDLDGCCLLPGFHDSHVHLTQHGLELDRLKLHDTQSLDEGLELVRARVAELPQGDWLLGAGFATSRWNVPDLRKEQLDAVAPHHPVFLRSQDHHSAWANSLALKRAGVHAATSDPQGGRIVRDADGSPSGLLLEHAAELVDRAVPEPARSELVRAVQRAGDDLAERGITTAHHMAYEPADHFREMGLAASRDDYPLRIWACIGEEHLEHAAPIGLATGQGGRRFTVGGAKLFVDGALGSLTAWMLEPYLGTDDTGVVIRDAEALAARLTTAIDVGFSPVIHAIGDGANRAALDALEATAAKWQAKGFRPRIEHAQHLHRDDVPRFAQLGVIASMQPQHMVFDAKRIGRRLGDRVERAYAYRALTEAGVRLVFGSDTPVTEPDVIQGLVAAALRLDSDGNEFNPSEALEVEEALAAYTRNPAFAIGRESASGRLRPGFDADLVILSDDPRKGLSGLRVEGTMVAGQWTKAFY